MIQIRDPAKCGWELVELDVLNLGIPLVEGGDVRSHGAHVDALGGEDNRVLALIDGNLNSPVDNGVEAGLVHGLAVALVPGSQH